jgi:Vitamin B6 photo-protection and homoeostasis
MLLTARVGNFIGVGLGSGGRNTTSWTRLLIGRASPSTRSHRALSTSKFTVVQYPASTRVRRGDHPDHPLVDGANDGDKVLDANASIVSRYGNKAVVYGCTDTNDASWQRQKPERYATATTQTASSILYDKVIRHFLPSNYPVSVDSGYARFSIFSFAAAVAGSASMVLSTQTLLLAVGVVGTNATAASAMAGALNWVLKDGVGQLGGVLFASRMGETRTFDANPKTWRMMAAITLDVAALLELLAPMMTSPSTILPLACAANVLKNIGFLTASASRAALHQSLAVSGNLADVTAKTGSQSMAAGLFGTAAGVGLSSLLHHDATNFIAGFVVLAAIHQTCNYAALKSVSLRHFNRQRLCIVAHHHVTNGKTLTPSQAAERERFLPVFPNDQDYSWLSIGSDLATLCPDGSAQLNRLLAACPGENYILNVVQDRVHLVFLDSAVGDDVILGMLHGFMLHKQQQQQTSEVKPFDDAAIAVSYRQAKTKFPLFLSQLHAAGWNTGTDVTNIEPGSAVRLAIAPQK